MWWANFDCDTENICGKLIWSERFSALAVMCVLERAFRNVNSFSILCVYARGVCKCVWWTGESVHIRSEPFVEIASTMKVKNGNEIIKFALTVAVEQPSRLHAHWHENATYTYTHIRSTSRRWAPAPNHICPVCLLTRSCSPSRSLHAMSVKCAI